MMYRWCLSIVSVLVLVGCSVLPSDEQHTKSPWSSFDEAKAAYDLIIPNKTTVTDLKALKYDPYTTSNITIWTYLDVIKVFIPNQAIKIKDLDPAIQECIKGREQCFAYRAHPNERNSERYGNFMLDLFGFRKKTEITKWEFNAVIVIIGNTVVYKIWDGTPMEIEHRDSKKPLGPLQSDGGLLNSFGF